MKIERIDSFIVPPRWCFVKVSTDKGIDGWGEPIVEGRAATRVALIDELSDYLIGKDPSKIEQLGPALYRGGSYRGGALHLSAVAGLDQALWDIHGKRHGMAVHQMLGGAVRDRIRIYSSIVGSEPIDLARQAKELKESGLTFIKMNAVEVLEPFVEFDEHSKAVARVAEVRDAIGPSIGLGIDLHGRVSRAQAKRLLNVLDEFEPSFYEEPVLSEHASALAEITNHTSTPIALGERLVSRWDFRPILESGHVDILQPDPCHAGGITETRKIAALAETYDVSLALHCPLGPIALAANLQLAAVCTNIQLQEQRLSVEKPSPDLRYVRSDQSYHYREGFVEIPKGPGLGIILDEVEIRAAAEIGHRWRNPIWHRQDNSFCEW